MLEKLSAQQVFEAYRRVVLKQREEGHTGEIPYEPSATWNEVPD